MQKRKPDILNITLIALFACIISVCSWLSVPVSAVPVTLQTFGVFCALLILGGKNGFLSILIYILLGLLGVPVFSGFKAGPSALFGLTGGYIIGFLLMALVFILFTKLIDNKLIIKVISLIIGLVICYAFGTFWFIIIYNAGESQIGIKSALSLCVLPFIIPDLLKLALAVAVYKALLPVLNKAVNRKNV